MTLIDKKRVVAKIERLMDETTDEDNYFYSAKAEAQYNILLTLKNSIDWIDTIELKEVIAEQECTCNEVLNRIVGSSWNLLCPVNKLGLKTGDKVKVIIKAQKGE